MDDTEIVHRINELADEERRWSADTSARAASTRRSRNGSPRSRSPLTSAGTSCGSAGPAATPARTPTPSVRPPGTVEGYQQ